MLDHNAHKFDPDAESADTHDRLLPALAGRTMQRRRWIEKKDPPIGLRPPLCRTEVPLPSDLSTAWKDCLPRKSSIGFARPGEEA